MPRETYSVQTKGSEISEGSSLSTGAFFLLKNPGFRGGPLSEAAKLANELEGFIFPVECAKGGSS